MELISRQAAIDIERNATVDTNPSHFVAHQKFTQFLDDAEISSFGRWQWSNGFNTALTAVGIDLKKLPPAQPDTEKICARIKAEAIKRNVEYMKHGDRYMLGFVDGMRLARRIVDGTVDDPVYFTVSGE